MDRILKFAARSAIRWHSTACCRHSTGVIIVALMTPHSQTEARPRPNSGPITRPESMCAGRFKISVARRQHSNSWRRRGPDGSGVLLTFLSLRPHREQIRGRPKLGGLHKITMECFFAPALVSYRRALNCWASVSSAHLRRCRSLTARAFSRYSSALFRKTSTLCPCRNPRSAPSKLGDGETICCTGALAR